MERGVQVRGEWISGRPFERARMRGWFVDVMVHRPELGPFTPVARCEQYRFDVPGHAVSWNRITAGMRLRLSPSLVAQVNWLNPGRLEGATASAFDIGLTHSVRF
jgi:hypothetical protein